MDQVSQKTNISKAILPMKRSAIGEGWADFFLAECFLNVFPSVFCHCCDVIAGMISIFATIGSI